ncbi:MAG: type II secretion system F family protein [Planctomycetota bacterium]|jgi:type IV pilus assembly protein PilC
MPIYKYEAMDSQGVGIKDEIEALSQKEAISKIRNMGYFPTKVLEHGAKKREAARAPAAVPKTKRGANSKVKVKYVTQFARQLSTLQDAGLPILRSLRILEEQQKSGKFKRIIRYLGDDIEGGSTLSEAFARYPRAFDRLFVGMVAAGETGGVLDLILARIADFMEKAQKLKSRVKSAMIYPIFVMSAAFGIVLLLMKFVIPSFRDTLTEMTDGASLPALTERVLGLSNWIAYHYGWAIIIAMPIGLVILLKITRQFSIGRYILDSIKLRLPIIGQLSGKIAVTRWTRTLGTLIGAGVPILSAINTSRETCGNEVFSHMLGKVHNSIRQGETFAAPLKQSRTVDSIVSNMIAVGEETGELDKMMLKIADNYDEQVDVLVSSLMSLLEPVLIIMLGSIVAVIVLSVFMPMIQIITSLSV